MPNRWRQLLNESDSANYAMLGQPRLLDRFPQLVDVLQKTDSMHKDERDVLAPATTRGFVETLQTNLRLEEVDDGASLPGKVSDSWVRGQLNVLQVQEVTKPCTEPNTVSCSDAEAYVCGLQEKLAKVGDVRLQISFDEFSGTVDVGASRTLLHRSEPSKRLNRGNRVGQTKKLSRARETFTAGVCLSPSQRLLGLLVFSKCPKNTLALINRDFGNILQAHITPSGSVLATENFTSRRSSRVSSQRQLNGSEIFAKSPVTEPGLLLMGFLPKLQNPEKRNIT